MTNRPTNGKGSIHPRAPIAPITGGLGLKAPAHALAAALPFEVEDPAAVRNLELDMIAADEAVNRSEAITGGVDHKFAVQKAVGLRAQAQLDRHVVPPCQTVDLAVGHGRGVKAGRCGTI